MKGGMQQLMKQAQQMQKRMEKLQEELEELQVEASAGGGMVTAHVNGKKRLVKLDIDKDVVDPNDVEMLQDLIVAAVNEAVRLAEEKHQEEMGKIVPTGMMGGLGGLFLMNDPILHLIRLLTRLPGVGERSATRIVFSLLAGDRDLARELSTAIHDVAENVHLCSQCCNLTQEDPCVICADTRREQDVICVVETVPDMMAVERSKAYHGRYHILHGALAPLEGVTPEKLKVRELLQRLQTSDVRELILATNPTVEGESTALYLRKLLAAVPGLRITRIATGIPKGGDLEFIDRATLAQALEARREI